MIPEIKQNWIKDLNSGLFVQGFNSLKRRNTFCAVGVLLTQYIPVDSWICIDRKEQKYIPEDKAVLWPNVRKWAEWDEADTRLYLEVVQANDYQKRNFKEIAKLIENFEA